MEQFSVADIFNIPLLQKCRLVCGAQGLSNPITGVNIIEAPDVVKWLQGGEVLLTNLYSLNELGPVEDFIRALSAKKLSALLIKTGVFVDAIPEAMIATAESCNLPIIEIDKDIFYRDIAFAITERLLDDRVSQLKFFKETHHCFIQLSLNNGTSQQIIDALHTFIDLPLIIYDRDFAPLCSTHAAMQEARPIKKTIEERPYFLRPCFLPGPAGEEFMQMVFPIDIIGHRKIYLAVCLVGNPIKSMHHIAIENAINALMIEYIKQEAVNEVEKRFHSDVLGELLSGSIRSSQSLHERASLLQWDLHKPYAVVSLALQVPKNARGQAGIEGQRLAYDHLYSLLTSHFPHSPLQARADRLIMLWATDLAQGRPWLAAIREDMEKLCQRWKKKHSTIPLQVGIGDVAPDITCLARSLQEAEDTLGIMQQVHLGSVVQAFSELGVYRLLCQFEDKSRLRTFIPASLQQLVSSKQSERNDLLKTLKVYVACNKNMKQAAEQLFVHHKTVAYRIEQIKKLTGLNLADPEELLQLQLGFKILEVMGNAELSISGNAQS